MKPLMIAVMTAALALPVAATAKQGNGNGNGNGHAKGHGAAKHLVVKNQANVAGCPPGLAKKSPACVPPGLAKKAYPGIGDVLDSDGYGTRYVLVRDPGRYGLEPYGTYYRINGQVFQVDRETREVLALVGAVSAILN